MPVVEVHSVPQDRSGRGGRCFGLPPRVSREARPNWNRGNGFACQPPGQPRSFLAYDIRLTLMDFPNLLG